MSLNAIFQQLEKEVVALRVEGKRRRAEKTPRKVDAPLRKVPSREQYIARLMKFSHTAESTGCREWTGCVDVCGYGKFNLGRESLAHRVAFTLLRGRIPKGVYVCHKCDNPSCINPNHLFLGTQFDNMRDSILKGRLFSEYRSRGEAVNTAKLTEDMVRSMRTVYSACQTEGEWAPHREKFAKLASVKSRWIDIVASGKRGWNHIKVDQTT